MLVNDQAVRRVAELTGDECWRLLASVPLGRVVFSQHAMPAVTVVNHLIDNNSIIIRAPRGTVIPGHSALAGTAELGSEAVVCYEADALDPAWRAGWSVVVTGLARPVGDPAAIARYARLLAPWKPGDAEQLIAIEPGMVTGRRLMP